MPKCLRPCMPVISHLTTTPITINKPGVQGVLDVDQAALICCLTRTVFLRNLGHIGQVWSAPAEVPEVIKESKLISNFLLQIVDLCQQHDQNVPEEEVIKMESTVSSVFLSLVLEINSKTLKALLF
ncbi:hypothetical protein KEM48_004726 [Puccinia striiformis f. sp. tritici PST-130]|nr:hypothetical protein H4Q26_004549 [Puccinia striiformis f. sp. tritici PST-130]KAI9610807.1 hypothetical protein KEM48_004726 [Puccinia striiformis f. sp. tritici PST-130]